VVAAVVLRRLAQRRARKLDREDRDFGLRTPGPLRRLLNRMAVAIAGREIHRGIRIRGIVAQLAFDQADTLEEQRPVDRRDPAHAADDVADRELFGSLALVLDPQHLVRRVVLLLERALQRLPRRCRRNRLVTERLQQFDHKRGR
jgi:hypothetical protein